MKCEMVEQGYKMGSCTVKTKEGEKKRACEATLKKKNGIYSRLIESAHLSRPEHYFSIYQSGCNHSCKKCHSWQFSQNVSGRWLSTDQIAEQVKQYESRVTYWEPRERATMWHTTELCRSCGQCVIHGSPGFLCPGRLKPSDILFSPQGFGPARNIVAFTGGDITCQVEFYAQATRKIKERCKNIWVLLETNGYGLTPKNLDILVESGLDSLWLDVKAYDEDIYRRLCGTTNEWILRAPKEIVKRGFVLEVLSLYIPGWVDTYQIKKIAELLCNVDESIPFTILAFFPANEMQEAPSATFSEMVDTYFQVKEVGLENVKLGNLSVFVKTEEEQGELLKKVGKEAIG